MIVQAQVRGWGVKQDFVSRQAKETRKSQGKKDMSVTREMWLVSAAWDAHWSLCVQGGECLSAYTCEHCHVSGAREGFLGRSDM